MNLSRMLLAGSALALVGGAASAQSYQAIPGVFAASDITPDGQIIVGGGSGGAFYWRWKVDPAPIFIGAQGAVAVSDDGTVIAGNMSDPTTGMKVAARWTQATGWVPLGGLTGSCSGTITSCYDMSGDGSTIVGLGWTGCSGQGFLWTQANGMQELEWLGNKGNRASAVSADGTVAVGFAQGNFSRTPAHWTTSDQLGVTPDMSDGGEYFGLTDDASILLGGRNGYAFFEENGVETNIGNLNPGWSGYAVDVSESGGTIIGYDVQLGGTEAWVWNPVTGIQGLQNRLLSLGVANVPYLGYASAITADGKTVVGSTQFQGAWVVEIPPGPIAKAYGCGFNNPPESLTHTAGASSIGSMIQLGVDDPTGSMVAPAFGLVSYSVQPAPGYPCGVPLPGFAMFGPVADLLISVAAPNPILTQIAPALWTTPTQPVTVDLPIPLDTNLYGIDLYAQGALFSPSTSKIGLTNGMRITIGLY
jgi:uncharacterized membrane protein